VNTASDLLHAPLRPATLSPQRSRLSTDAVDAPDRFAYWLDMICALG